MRVIIADDEPSILLTLEEDLKEAGHDVRTARSGDDVLKLVEADRPDCIVSDINMPGLRGDELLRRVKALDSSIAVILMTGFGSVDSAVQAMKDGAADYLLKPFLNEQVVRALAHIGTVRALRRENETLRDRVAELSMFDGIVASSPAMQEVMAVVKTVARSESTILILGETGTGKEVTARALHQNSNRRGGPMIAISCAAIPSTLIEDELFGHEKGAFTDARERKAGRIERAEGGTFFLDDIDDMPMDAQVKLLRVLQEREVERLGGTKVQKVDVRVIAATKFDLRTRVREGKFREDLFYRLNVVQVRLPPLRERPGDIAPLVQHFLRKHGGGRDFEVRPEDLAVMETYSWPGNVRELEHSVERAIAFAGNAHFLRREHLVEMSPVHRSAPKEPVHLRSLKEVLEIAEREHVKEVLRAVGDHRAQAATILGISRKSLWEKLRLFGLDPGEE